MRHLSRIIGIGYILICAATLIGTAFVGPLGYAPFPLPLGPARTPVVVTVWYGTEKEAWLKEAVTRYLATAPTLNGRPIQIELKGLGSREMVEQVVQQRWGADPPPTVISPAGSLWVELMESDWLARNPGAQPIVAEGADAPQPLVLTPLVLVAWEDRAKVLWPNGPTDLWRDLHDALADPQGWVGRGGPGAWGFVKFGHTSPLTSNSGTQTLLLLAYGFYKKTSKLSGDDILNPEFQKWLAEVEQGVTEFGDSTGTFMTNMVRFGPSKYDVVAVYENLALQDVETAQGRWGQSIRIYYPPATLLSDHPYVTLQGHPEWGPFQFGHTHPDYSNSGIVSVLAEIYAAVGKTRGLTVADVQQPATAAFVKAVESGVIHYGESTGFFADQLFNRGPGYLSAAVLYENLVVQSRDRAKYPNVALPVVALYPKEGTFWSDHPYAILNAPWVDAEQRVAATTLRDFLLAKPQQDLALQLGFRPGDPSIPIGAPIDSAHGVDPRQPQTLLEVPSADVITAARAVWGQNKKRVEVMAVLDVSGSMNDEDRLERAKTALQTFIRQLADEDGFGLTIFSSQATVLSPISPLGPKRQQLLDQVGGLIAQGGTRLFDTIGEAYQPLSAQPSGQRIRALVILTDGEDNESRATADDLVRQLERNEEGQSIKVFTIAYSSGAQGSVDALKHIAQASGAKSYTPDIPIDQVYRDIGTFF